MVMSLATALVSAAWAMPADQLPSDGVYYKLNTSFRGVGMSLDVINGGADNHKIHLVPDSNETGQFWHIIPDDAGKYYRLKTLWLGESVCLDVSPSSPQPKMSACGNFKGQNWYLETVGNETSAKKLKNDFSGPSMCLNVIPSTNMVEMRQCGNHKEQSWHFDETDKPTP